MSDHDEPRIVSLIDQETKQELPCRVMADVDVEGQSYALLTPTMPWVNVVRTEAGEEGGLSEVELSDFPAIAPLLNEALNHAKVRIETRADEYVLVGEVPESLLEDSDVLGVENEDGESENFLVLAEVEHQGSSYYVMAPEMPAMFPVKMVDGQPEELSDEELETVQSRFEEALEGIAQD